MVASASYIAAAAAVRMSLPEANPAPGLVAALLVSFSFCLAAGIPRYAQNARDGVKVGGRARARQRSPARFAGRVARGLRVRLPTDRG
jgi:hypothetical protein